MAKQYRTFSYGSNIDDLVEHLVEVVAEDYESPDAETIRRGVIEIAAVLATQYPDPRARQGYLDMIADALDLRSRAEGSTLSHSLTARQGN